MDEEARRHVLEALLRHCQALRRDGQLPPASVTGLIDALSAQVAAIPGQARPGVDGVAGRLLTYRQAARLLGVSERTVRRRVADGDLVPVRFGRRRFIAANEMPGGGAWTGSRSAAGSS